MPTVCGRRPADGSAACDIQPIHLPHEAHAISAILQENVALAIGIEITRPDRTPIVCWRRPADDAAGFYGQPVHLPGEALAIIAILQENVTLAVAIEIAGSHCMPIVCRRRPADAAAGFDVQPVQLPDETHAVCAVLQEDVAMAIGIEIAWGFICVRHVIHFDGDILFDGVESVGRQHVKRVRVVLFNTPRRLVVRRILECDVSGGAVDVEQTSVAPSCEGIGEARAAADSF